MGVGYAKYFSIQSGEYIYIKYSLTSCRPQPSLAFLKPLFPGCFKHFENHENQNNIFIVIKRTHELKDVLQILRLNGMSSESRAHICFEGSGSLTVA